MARTITATQTLPELIAIVGYRDCGPFVDGEPTGECPHCGAFGRHIWTFICADGSRHAAMSGCIKLFPESRGSCSKLIRKAFEKKSELSAANEARGSSARPRKLASWWVEMIAAVEEFADTPMHDHDEIAAATDIMRRAVSYAESKRQTWLSQNGYGYKGYRR